MIEVNRESHTFFSFFWAAAEKKIHGLVELPFRVIFPSLIFLNIFFLSLAISIHT